jgi:hypothetical protein
MNDFLLVFRNDVALSQTQMSPDQMQALMSTWQNWMVVLQHKINW